MIMHINSRLSRHTCISNIQYARFLFTYIHNKHVFDMRFQLVRIIYMLLLNISYYMWVKYEEQLPDYEVSFLFIHLKESLQCQRCSTYKVKSIKSGLFSLSVNLVVIFLMNPSDADCEMSERIPRREF